MRVFLSGATGVLGRRVVPLLLAHGHEVSAVGRTSEKCVAIERAGASAVQLDLFDTAAVRRALSGYAVVVNLATHIPPNERLFLPGAWRENDRIRREVSANLAAGAIAGGAKRFIQESFAFIYESQGDAWIDEAAPVRPARYNRTVLDAEAAAAQFTASGEAGVVLRFAAFYGPDAAQTRDLIRALRKGFAPLPGSPAAFFPAISHDDAAAAVLAALHAPAGIYNVVDDEPVRHREYVDSLARVLDVRMPRLPPAWITPLLGSLGETLSRSLRLSNRKLRDECGWTPRYPSVREGWDATVAAMGA